MAMRSGRLRPIEGTLDLVTPPDLMRPGRAISAKNYEPVMRGARRYSGYERYDGQPKPSDQSYWTLPFDAGTVEVAAGTAVTGANSGATGIVSTVAVIDSGSYVGTDAVGYMILREVTGTWADNDPIQVSAVTKAVATDTTAKRGASNDTLDATYLQAAIEAARALIAAPTGSGSILGVWKFKGIRYCFRNNAGATATDMWKSSAAGWVQVDLGYQLVFTSGGTAEIAEGHVITGDTSTETATVRRIILTSGAWADGDAAGKLIIYSPSGAFSAENISTPTQANIATIAADATAQTLVASGDYRFYTHNFYGSSDLIRFYGVNGVNRGFEFDGNYFVMIDTGMTDDRPTHIGMFKAQLVFAFRGGSRQNSDIGSPHEWTTFAGASEIGLGREMTNMLSGWGAVQVLTSRSTLKILYGNNSDDYVLDDENDYAGAYEDTLQLVGSTPVFMDDTGLRKLSGDSSDKMGNFNLGTLSLLQEPFFAAKRAAGVLPTCSIVAKRRDQYRVFFDDGSALFVFFGRKTSPERLPCVLPLEFDDEVLCVCAEICGTGDDAGEEVIIFGSDDGMVYEMDVGTSFDGAVIQAYHRMTWDNDGTPNRNKQYKKSHLKLDADPSVQIFASALFSGGDTDRDATPELAFDVDGGGGIYNQDAWNQFYWSSRLVGKAEVPTEGVGTDISLAVLSESAYEGVHTLHAIQHYYAPRGIDR